MHRNRLHQLEGQRGASGELSSDKIQYLLNAAPLLREYETETKRVKELQENERKKEEEESSKKPPQRKYGNIKDFVTVQTADKGTSGLGTLNLKYVVATADPLSPQYAAAHSALTDILIRKGEYKQDIHTCPDCEVTLLSIPHEGSMVCPECGLSETVLGFSRENLTYEQEITCNVTPSFSYKRAVHLIEWLNQILGKETTVIPQDVIDKVKAEFRKARITSVDEINPQRVRGYLKKLNLSKFYEHSVSICQSLGVSPPRLSPETEEKIIVMFSAVQEPFQKYAPEGRSVDMKNVVSPKCFCGKSQPQYGLKGGRATHCSKCRSDNMIDVKSQKCEKVSRNLKVKEQHFADAIKAADILPEHADITFDKRVQGGCSARRPDVFVDMYTHTVHLENDEDQHRNSACENKRLMELFQDAGNRPQVQLRFNPDGFTSAGGRKVPSCFQYNKLGVPVIRDKSMWENRNRAYIERLRHHLTHVPEREVTVEHMFYDGYDWESEVPSQQVGQKRKRA
ncbi:hypothetical virus protein [Klebsormidium nitens]|uniref:Hypothetical virus protein n=1 Tax=Klebsormidium nitens TaxID=105231 RepID=A0A1Y1IPE7_KLENI|nr:hypothetical virus protein [Klebsormidium nitens]|eukprot:GAQ89988.1 hypothetical virus protein [Klebsormidium nitens]